MTVLRISSYYAGKIPDYLEKQLHKMSFYQENVIICEENERAGYAESEIKSRVGVLRQKGRRDGEVSSSAAELH